MTGNVNDGDLVTVTPCVPETLVVGNIVLVRVRGNDYLPFNQSEKQSMVSNRK